MLLRYLRRLSGYCLNHKVEGATSVLSDGSVTCAEPPPPPTRGPDTCHKNVSDTNPVT
jgi:hypothetical protein